MHEMAFYKYVVFGHRGYLNKTIYSMYDLRETYLGYRPKKRTRKATKPTRQDKNLINRYS